MLLATNDVGEKAQPRRAGPDSLERCGLIQWGGITLDSSKRQTQAVAAAVARAHWPARQHVTFRLHKTVWMSVMQMGSISLLVCPPGNVNRTSFSSSVNACFTTKPVTPKGFCTQVPKQRFI